MDQKTPSGTPTSGQRAYTRNVLMFSLCMIAAWVVQLLALPWSLFAAVFAILGIVYLVRMLRGGSDGRRPGTTVALAVIGFLVCAMVIGVTLISAIFYQPITAQAECLERALTEQARRQCVEQAPEAARQWVDGLFG